MEFDQVIVEKIPEIKEIQSVALREKVISAWQFAFQDSLWKCAIDEVPFNDKINGITLIKHTRSVTQEAIAMAKHLQETYDVELNRDYVLAIALLHDCCKLVETKPDENNVSVKSEVGGLYPHGAMSFAYAKKAGLPEEVCHAILTHTAQCRMTPKTLEGLLVRYVDSLDADCLYFLSPYPTLMERGNK